MAVTFTTVWDTIQALEAEQKKQALANKSKITQLSTHFSLEEMIHTSHSEIDNHPNDQQIIKNLQNLCMFVLEPVRMHYGKVVHVTSGYRSPALNKKIGGATNSQHSKGEAADFHITGVSNPDLAKWIYNNLMFDQLILEFYKTGVPDSGWVHCSYRISGNRKQFLTAQKNGDSTRYEAADPSKLKY